MLLNPLLDIIVMFETHSVGQTPSSRERFLVCVKFPHCGWNNQLLEYDVSVSRWSLVESSVSSRISRHYR